MPAIRQPFWVREPLLRSRGVVSLLDGLVHYYKMEEAAGARVDTLANGNWAVGAGAPGQAAGKNNFGASLSVGNTLTIATSTLLRPVFTLACWLNVSNRNNGANATAVIGSESTLGGFDLSFISIVGAADVQCQFWPSGIHANFSNAQNVLSLGAFHAVIISYDGTRGLCRIDNATSQTSAGAFSSTAGTNEDLSFAAQGANFVGDELAVWSRVLSTAEQDAWVSGRFYPFT